MIITATTVIFQDASHATTTTTSVAPITVFPVHQIVSAVSIVPLVSNATTVMLWNLAEYALLQEVEE